MTVLVTGATGLVGSLVVEGLVAGGVPVRALTRSPEGGHFPDGVTPVGGDLLDVDALRAALAGVSTVFVLSAVMAEELTGTLLALDLAREAGVKGIVYLSVYRGGDFSDVAHLNAKFAAERMIEQADLPATVLRPAYFAQNDAELKGALAGGGVYPIPLGHVGVSIVDARDVADAAVIELLRREREETALPRVVYDLVGPDALTGPALAQIWSEALGKTVGYGGDDLDGPEKQMRQFRPAWFAFEIRQMLARFQADGAAATGEGLAGLQALLGRAPRSYRDFAAETARQWLTASA